MEIVVGFLAILNSFGSKDGNPHSQIIAHNSLLKALGLALEMKTLYAQGTHRCSPRGPGQWEGRVDVCMISLHKQHVSSMSIVQ